ncbi:MAG: AraC family transcriptional regulator [Clostridia bacterium]|nr:AraC family transcriptional regulator [Clostridia bacterium]
MKRYYNLELKKTVSVTGLKTVENLYLDKNFFYPTETHKFYELIYVLDGEVCCENDDAILRLDKGKFKLTPPNVSHRYFTDTNANVFIICFTCKSALLSVLSAPTILEYDEKKLIEKLMREIEKSFELPFRERVILKKDAPIGAQQITENIIEEFLILLIRKTIEKDEIKVVKNETELEKNLINDIKEILRDNIYGNISLSEICKQLFYCSTYLNNIFKRHAKTTIMQYYNDLKIEEAKLLLKSGLPVSKVADKLHFGDPNYFSKAFRKKTGYSPSSYKNIKIDQF